MCLCGAQENIAKELAKHAVGAAGSDQARPGLGLETGRARSGRVRYAGHEKIWQHLHRHALADLFLDNLEYNGGTTGL